MSVQIFQTIESVSWEDEKTNKPEAFNFLASLVFQVQISVQIIICTDT